MQHPRAVAQAPSRSDRIAVPARLSRRALWNEILRCHDISLLWRELQRVVVNHPLVRASHDAGLLIEEGDARRNACKDLTQELFVRLLQKSRFQHYRDTEMTDAEIDCEIGQIELTNLLTSELRKRYPESYRLARRISTIIQSSVKFCRFDTSAGEEAAPRRLADRIYGLSEWRGSKSYGSSHDLKQRVRFVPVRQRDTRVTGCTGDTQIIITNADLEDLIISVLEACDTPVNMRLLRTLVISRLPVMDIYLVPLRAAGESDGRDFDPVDGCENPEQLLISRESEREAVALVDLFLKDLHGAVRGKAKQYDRILGVLWHCYLSPKRVTQLAVAAHLNVSDSLVSDYRCRIEQRLRALSFSRITEARLFETSLRERVGALVLSFPTVVHEEDKELTAP